MFCVRNSVFFIPSKTQNTEHNIENINKEKSEQDLTFSLVQCCEIIIDVFLWNLMMHVTHKYEDEDIPLV